MSSKSEEYDGEPIYGLPALLPPGESILWQGAPDFRTLANRALHLRSLSWYFGLLAVWGIFGRLSSGAPVLSVALAILEFAGVALAALGILWLFAWLVARSTVYTITNRRVVMRFGVALPITLQIPFNQVSAAGVKRFTGGVGDISLSVLGKQNIGYLILWPHARPWKFAKSEPTLRSIAKVDEVAAILGRALAASAEQSAQPLMVMRDTSKRDSRLPATA
jgi:hypothetical protein